MEAFMRDYTRDFLKLVRLAATDLPPDVEASLVEARRARGPGLGRPGRHGHDPQERRLARENSTPICQDTGTPIFYVKHPEGWSTRKLREQIRAAVAEATRLSYLRPNAVDSLSGKNSGNNLGDEAFPTIHFEEVEGDELMVDLLLKGGGCENVGAQYSLPNSRPGPGATWRACARSCWMRCTRPKARAARRASWAWPSAATAARPITPPRKCSSARWTSPTPTRSWPHWRAD